MAHDGFETTTAHKAQNGTRLTTRRPEDDDIPPGAPRTTTYRPAPRGRRLTARRSATKTGSATTPQRRCNDLRPRRRKPETKPLAHNNEIPRDVSLPFQALSPSHPIFRLRGSTGPQGFNPNYNLDAGNIPATRPIFGCAEFPVRSS